MICPSLSKLRPALVFLLLTCYGWNAQIPLQFAYQYLNRHKDIAVQQMVKYHIPASVILAQAIFESESGTSQLAFRSNNHFGIKCHKEWIGDTVHYHDDEPQECFRMYASVEDSYNDHSLFLVSRPRYAHLFQIPIEDYRAWCYGIKDAGYATYPTYAEELVRIIEKHQLYLLDTYHALNSFVHQPEQDIVKSTVDLSSVTLWDFCRADLLRRDETEMPEQAMLLARSFRMPTPEITTSRIHIERYTIEDFCNGDLLVTDEPVKGEKYRRLVTVTPQAPQPKVTVVNIDPAKYSLYELSRLGLIAADEDEVAKARSFEQMTIDRIFAQMREAESEQPGQMESIRVPFVVTASVVREPVLMLVDLPHTSRASFSNYFTREKFIPLKRKDVKVDEQEIRISNVGSQYSLKDFCSSGMLVQDEMAPPPPYMRLTASLPSLPGTEVRPATIDVRNFTLWDFCAAGLLQENEDIAIETFRFEQKAIDRIFDMLQKEKVPTEKLVIQKLELTWKPQPLSEVRNTPIRVNDFTLWDFCRANLLNSEEVKEPVILAGW